MFLVPCSLDPCCGAAVAAGERGGEGQGHEVIGENGFKLAKGRVRAETGEKFLTQRAVRH